MTRKKHIVTVVITSFNREAYLGASIESVLNSSFEDFELLVLDNCSADASVEVAQSYAKLDARVTVVVNEKNLGQFGNRNRAIELVESPFLKYHDSDDLMYPYCLGTLVELLESEPKAGFTLSSGHAWPGGPCPMLLSPELAYAREFLGGGLFFCGPSGALFRTEVLRQLGGFPERGAPSDYCFWLKACVRTSVLLVPADLFWYRVHPDQEYQSAAARHEYALADGDGWKALNAPDCPLQGESLVKAKRSCLRTLLKLHLRDLRSGQWSLIRTRSRHAGVGWGDWVRFAPRVTRSLIAGTPLDTGGQYLEPEWLRLDPSRRPSEETERD